MSISNVTVNQNIDSQNEETDTHIYIKVFSVLFFQLNIFSKKKAPNSLTIPSRPRKLTNNNTQHLAKSQTERKQKKHPLKRTADTRLYLLITHHKTALLVPRNQHHPLIRARVQLVEAHKHMREVQKRVPMLVHLVEDIVPEELDDISIACL